MTRELWESEMRVMMAKAKHLHRIALRLQGQDHDRKDNLAADLCDNLQEVISKAKKLGLD